MPTSLEFSTPDRVTRDVDALIIVGTKTRLEADDVRALLPQGVAAVWSKMIAGLRPGDAGEHATTWLDGAGPSRLCAAALPDLASRHNSPGRPHAVTELVAKCVDKGQKIGVIVALADADHAFAAGCAVARALPVYTTKRENGDNRARAVVVAFQAPSGPVAADAVLQATAAEIRVCARLVDMPTSELHTDAFCDEARAAAAELGCGIEIIAGHELRDRGFGGLWGVGQAADHPPALVILKHEPKDASRTVCWVGKGIVYDTGGLSLKMRDSMVGMKRDMAGAAGVFGAFKAAVRSGFPDRLYALLCLAENAVGPASTRPDDILKLYSGKTVEINNTDAEGRLVLGDGVAYAAKHLQPDVIVDMATLTGAQMISTGSLHAAIVCNDDELEARAITAGRHSGDLVHPLVYAPEVFRSEFDSKIADLKNSVKNRLNAQSSCAAQFVAEHLGDYTKPWLHIDMAGPSDSNERGTGYGVALLVDMFRPA